MPTVIALAKFVCNTASKVGAARRGFQTLNNQKCVGIKENVAELDPIQVKLLEEMCIIVDDQDNVLDARSKRDCHLMENINKGLLHRAFSVFLFNEKDELLLQQRSDSKITFPGYYTNTCCSHPLYDPSELEEKDAIGVKKAAQRRLEIELGIPSSQLPLKDFHYMTRILYTAPSNGMWGEREIDYALIVQKNVDLQPNPNEVKDYRYVSQKDLREFLASVQKEGHPITPWFQLIVDSFLFKWWADLKNLEPMKDHQTIHYFN